MSVQAGIWNFDGEPVNPDSLAKISRETYRYGPDGEAIYSKGPVSLLYRAFHTTLESHFERQPHVFAKGTVLLWDGRIDNREELISQLGWDLVGNESDVEIVAASFERWKTKCFAKLIGDWALSIWMPQQQELILARDYIGVRQLFYYAAPHRFAWCTELSALVTSGDVFNVCHEYIAGYLALYPATHLTPYKEIRSVPPGKFVFVNERKITTHSYWMFDPGLRTNFKSDAEYEERFRDLLAGAVRRRLRTDSKILADLSGGLDSSSIVVVADKVQTDRSLDKFELDTFSCFDLNEPDDEDLPFLELVEQMRGHRGHHASVQSTGDSFSFDYPEFVATPGFDGRQEFRNARQEVLDRFHYRVVLSGQGGDEVNGQALDICIPIADSLSRFRARRAANQLVTWSLRSRYPFVQLFWKSLNLLLPAFLRWTKPPHTVEMAGWINPRFARQHGMFDDLRGSIAGSWRWLPSARDAYQTIEILSRDMTNHRPSTVEMRYPFLDQTLVEFLTSIPTDQLLRPGSRRSLMRRALSGILPPEIVVRRTKTSTGRCVAISLQKHWNVIESLLQAPIISEVGYVDVKAFRMVLEHTRSGHFVDLVRTLRTLSLECWLRQAVNCGVLTVSRGDWHGRVSVMREEVTRNNNVASRAAVNSFVDVARMNSYDASGLKGNKRSVLNLKKGGSHHERVS
jgi:asparagine synthase (glutamine-hydrolysing)